jgi:hypothetical protein
MAAPTHRGNGVFGSGTTSCTAAAPTGGSAPVEGDAAYIIVESSDSTTAAGTPNTPSGWTKLLEVTSGAGATGVTTLTVFGRIVPAGGQGDVTIDGVGNHCGAAMTVVADHGMGAITDTIIGTVTDHGTGTTGLTTSGITLPHPDCFILWVMGLSDDAADTTNASAQTNANLSSITERIDNTVTAGAGGGLSFCTATCAGTTTGNGTWDHDTAERSQSVYLGIAPKVVPPEHGMRRARAVV